VHDNFIEQENFRQLSPRVVTIALRGGVVQFLK